MTESVCAIIPARGGSKAIPRKNLRSVCGKPLLAYAITAASQASRVDRVVVSTDDEEIAAVATAFGAMVIMRPSALASDTASSESALLHALEQLANDGDYRPNVLAFVQCTSPLTLAEDIDGTIEVVLDRRADCAFAVTPFHGFVWTGDASESARGINHDPARRPMRQQRRPEYLETGAVYAMRVPGFLVAQHRFFGRIGMYVMPRERCFEVDEPGDLYVVETLLRSRRHAGGSERLPARPRALVLDFDGVFTDNRVIVHEDGSEAVTCNRGDGMGLAQLRRFGLPIVVISTETNSVVAARCRKLGLPCVTSVEDKLQVLRKWLQEKEISAADVVYVGNDINDVDCLREVGCGVVVNDAHPEACAVADLRLAATGGNGALRELADMLEAKLGGAR